MTTYIFNDKGNCRSEGKNLEILSTYARRHAGVRSITISRLQNSRYEAHVAVLFVTGWYGLANFVDFSHAVEWAKNRAKPNRFSWWSGCEVIIKD